jgi:uncharacterized NAD-dependent epimerase/dehydratase family protein
MKKPKKCINLETVINKRKKEIRKVNVLFTNGKIGKNTTYTGIFLKYKTALNGEEEG